jgi:DNA-binding transcriptional LysR family regulator
MDMTTRRCMSPQEIDLLIALASATSFTEAAELLNLTQSAVSRAVAKVEVLLNTELVVRGKFGCRATRQLTLLQPKLRRARHALEALCPRDGALDEGVHGRIRVAGFRSAVCILLPETIATFMARYRHVRVSLSTVREVGGGVQQAVLDGNADFGLTTVRPQRQLRSIHLGADRYVVVRRRGTRQRPIPARECLILWDERCSECVPEILKANKWSPLETMSVNSDLGVLAMIEHGAGFAILPKLATEPLPVRLECIPLPVETRRDIWLCGRSDRWDTPTGKAFRRYIVRGVTARLSADKLEQ